MHIPTKEYPQPAAADGLRTILVGPSDVASTVGKIGALRTLQGNMVAISFERWYLARLISPN
jgi:2-keto-3-deoxy-L-rhamnonate aldolase RhmA